MKPILRAQHTEQCVYHYLRPCLSILVFLSFRIDDLSVHSAVQPNTACWLASQLKS